MLYPVHLDRPVPRQEPADCVRTFVFLANLAAQEASGDPAASISVERAVHRLKGSAESDSVMLGLLAADDAALSRTLPHSELGYPLIPSTQPLDGVGAGPAHDFFDFAGFVHISLPQLEERHILEFELVLDADVQPLPGAKLSRAARERVALLLSLVEEVARARERTVLQTSILHPVGSLPGTGPWAEELAGHGFRTGLSEVQSVIQVPDSAPVAPPAGYRVQVIENYQVPDELIDDVAALFTTASRDVPHGTMSTEPAQWEARRLAEAAARLRDRGSRQLMAVLIDPDGEAHALSEFFWHAGSHPEVVEQGATIVARGRRRRGLGTAAMQWGLAAVRSAWPEVERVYASESTEDPAMLSIHLAAGMTPISGSSSWEKDLNK